MPKKTEASKVLQVEMGSGTNPRFSFKGDWHGRDVRAIHALLPREYRKHQRSERREEIVATPKQEVSDGRTS